MSKLSTDPYKGVRDFYPEDAREQSYIFATWRKACESFGYVEYNASVLEPTALYTEKSGEEIVNEQTYSFKDRGDRDVTLRPEMTPTVARMVAAKKRELSFPLRWFSIPNVFRYERPQRGRLREHWQLNCDIFGLDTIDAEVEMIRLAYSIMTRFGAQESDFEIRINSRKIINKALADLGLSEEQSYQFQKLLDKKNKIDDFEAQAEKIAGKPIVWKLEPDEEIRELMQKLHTSGISNVKFDDTLVRGFDYYTGVVFELFDTHPDNNRALFGGGRYDELLSLFGNDKVSAVGFGMGDVTARDFLESRNILPKYKSSTQVYIAPLAENLITKADHIANLLRLEDINVAVDYTDKKIGDQIKKADKDKIQFVIVVGETEAKDDVYKIKDLLTGEETILPLGSIGNFVKSSVTN